MDRQQLLGEVDDVIRTMPPRETMRHGTDEHLAWFGRAAAVMDAWNPAKAAAFNVALDDVQSRMAAIDSQAALLKALALLQQASYSLRMETVGPLSTAVAQGATFDYFDEVRKIIGKASNDVLFVDPYIDAEFVSKYLPQLKSGVMVRLLTQHCIPSLVPAAAAFQAQHGLALYVRSIGGMHDRYVFIDGTECFQSGASFKDGAKKSPTLLTQIVDAFPVVRDWYEAKWTNAKVEK